MKVFLSKKSYKTKPDKAAAMIKCKSNYNLVDIEPHELYKSLSNGHFYHNECGTSESLSGSKQETFKKSLLKQSQIICIDFDYKLKSTKPNGQTIEHEYLENEMPKWSNELLSDLHLDTNIGKISISPTFWIESYSANTSKEDKVVGNSVHLFYVLDDEITSILSFKKVATALLYALVVALKKKGYSIPLSENGKSPIDRISLDMAQGIWGSYGKSHGWIGETYFAHEWENAYKDEQYEQLFPYSYADNESPTDDEIERAVNAYKEVKSIEDIDVFKSRYLKYGSYFGHNETYKIIAYLKYSYKDIDEDVNMKSSLCYNVCKKLLLEHSEFTSEEHFYREYKRQNTYKDRYKNAVIKLIGETGAIPLDKIAPADNKYDHSIRITQKEHLSDIKGLILEKCQYGKVNLIVASPGTGKTEFAKRLDGNTLVIELFNSIISSEEKFPSSVANKYFGDHYIPFTPESKLSVCSANKFISRAQSDQMEISNAVALYPWMQDELTQEQIELANELSIYSLLQYDNIVLDESHLLALSNYRYDVMGKTVSLIKKLAKIGKSRVILMTGTPFGESFLFEGLNTIHVVKKQKFKRDFNVIKCRSVKSTLSSLVSDALANGRRVFMPIDSENYFNTMVENLALDGVVKKEDCFYFSQPHREDDLEIEILDSKQIGECKLLGASSYMSVGIDIEDYKTKFDIIFVYNASVSGNFCGIEIEQFANRHRKQDLNCFYLLPETVDLEANSFVGASWGKMLSIKNRVLISMYKEDPKIIHLPAYIEEGIDGCLSVNEDMLKCYLYYKDNYKHACKPNVTIETLESIGWKIGITESTCSFKMQITEDENRKEFKKAGCNEFLRFLDDYEKCGYPVALCSISQNYEMNVLEQDNLMFASKVEVKFSNLYAKNTLLDKWLSLREWFTAESATQIFKDNYDGECFNISSISRVCKAVKLMDAPSKSYVWEKIENEMRKLVDGKSWATKKELKNSISSTVDGIFDELCNDVEFEDMFAMQDETMKIGESLHSDFIEGVKVVMLMHVVSKPRVVRNGKKTCKVIETKWENNALSKYDVKRC